MLALADAQSRLRRAVVAGDTADIVPLIVGGRDPERRLAIHQRHYRSSLVTALLTTFPATLWLVGTPFLEAAARQFVGQCPPGGPCMAEYGREFPSFLSGRPGCERLPYLSEFAELEWHVGRVAISIDRPALALEALSTIDAARLIDAQLTMQSGVSWLHASWPVDDLMNLYLAGTAPDRYPFMPADVWLEVGGARGQFRISRLEAAEFAFRRSLRDGRPIGEAAECALAASTAFDAGHSLVTLVAEGLVTAVTRGGEAKP